MNTLLFRLIYIKLKLEYQNYLIVVLNLNLIQIKFEKKKKNNCARHHEFNKLKHNLLLKVI
jgi:hypothetical protein